MIAQCNIAPRANVPHIAKAAPCCGQLTVIAGIAAMPRYFFHTRMGQDLVSDPDGEELRDPDHAWEVASAMIRQLLQTEETRPGLLSAVLEVTDAEGEIVLEFPFSEALIEAPDPGATRH
jgi:hypothetical protein